MAAAAGGAGVDPNLANMDPELAMALRLSMETAMAEAGNTTGGGGDGGSSGEGAGDGGSGESISPVLESGLGKGRGEIKRPSHTAAHIANALWDARSLAAPWFVRPPLLSYNTNEMKNIPSLPHSSFPFLLQQALRVVPLALAGRTISCAKRWQ